MPSPAAERRARKLRADRDRCARAAALLRHRATQAHYAGLRGRYEGYALAALIDSGGVLLDQLPPAYARDLLAAVTTVLDDDPAKLGPVPPLTSGPGH